MAVKSNPKQQAKKQEAIRAYQRGNLASARSQLEKLIRKQPADVETNMFLGMVYNSLQLYEKAEPLFRKVLKLKPDFIEAMGNLAIALINLGKPAEAITLLEKVYAANPQDAYACFNLGVAHERLEKKDEAIDWYLRVLELEPGNYETCVNLGALYTGLQRFADAERFFETAINKDPSNPMAYLNEGNLMKRLARYPEAIECYSRALRFAPNIPGATENLALVYQEMGDNQKALELYQSKSAGEKQASTLIDEGNVLKHMGQFNQATDCFRAAIVKDKNNCDAYYSLASLKKLDSGHDLVAMEELMAHADIDSEGRSQLCFALASAYHQQKDYARAMDYYNQANSIKRATYQYDIDSDRNFFKEIRESFSVASVSGLGDSGINDNAPIFIVGMPRSGTTLVEQILASHSHVTGAGELKFLKTIIEEYYSASGTGDEYPKILPGLTNELPALGQEYLRRLRTQVPDAVRIVDKMPHNFLYLGLLFAMLPQARVIHCTRDPIDTCWSIYTLSFTTLHKYSYDLNELAQYYLFYQELMQHWHHLFGDRIYEVNYETLVTQPDEQIRKLVHACELEWEDTCLQFHKNKRGVATASATQVRQPIYLTGQKRWGPYKEHLGVLLDVFSRKVSTD